MALLFPELTYAVRTLRRRPAFLLTAAGTLAIGICANVTVFSMVNGVLLRPMPFGVSTDRVVALRSTNRLQPEDWDNSGVSSADLLDVGRETQSFEHVGGYIVRNFTVMSEEGTERLTGVSVTPDLFPMLGIEAALGRTFTPADAAAPSGFETAVILTHGVWQSHYGGDPDIIGRAVIINDRAWTVVGVMPPGFRFPHTAQLYAPLFLDVDSARTIRTVSGIGLLKPGLTRQQVQADIDAVAGRLESAFPTTNRGYGIRVLTFRDSQVTPQTRIAMGALMGAVVFVLLIACANLANLLFVRGAARQRDMAIHAAMGASRARLMGQVLAESTIVAIAGTAVGLAGTLWWIRVIPSAWPEEFPYWLRLDPDTRITAFTIGLTIFTTLAIGLLPAIRVSRLRVTGPLSHGATSPLGRSSHRIQRGLAVGQVALCLALLVGAHLMIRSFLSLQSATLGFEERPLLSLRVFATGDAFDRIPARAALFARALDAVKALPGVTAAAATSAVPGDDGGAVIRVTKDGAAEQFVGAQAISVTSGLFDTLAVRMQEGRTFTANEVQNPESDAVVINRTLARRLWPGQSALERRIGIATADPRVDGVSWRRVVGVAPDLVYEELGEQTEQARLNVYLPYARSPLRTMAFLIRADGNLAALMEPARRALRRIHPGLATFDLATMSERRRLTTGEQRAFGTIMGAFAAAALLLACLGIYGLLADTARQRTQEIGLRLALGATPRTILNLFVRQAAIIGAAGLIIGTALAVLVAQALSGVLFGIDSLAVMPFALTAAALMAVVLLSAYGPARRVSKVDPLVALRIV